MTVHLQGQTCWQPQPGWSWQPSCWHYRALRRAREGAPSDDICWSQGPAGDRSRSPALAGSHAILSGGGQLAASTIAAASRRNSVRRDCWQRCGSPLVRSERRGHLRTTNPDQAYASPAHVSRPPACGGQQDDDHRAASVRPAEAGPVEGVRDPADRPARRPDALASSPPTSGTGPRAVRPIRPTPSPASTSPQVPARSSQRPMADMGRAPPCARPRPADRHDNSLQPTPGSAPPRDPLPVT